MGGLLLRIKEWWQSADRTQKLIAVCGSGFLVFLLAGTFIFASRPKMALLFTNLDPADTGSVQAELETMSIPSDIDENGNVRVPSTKVAQARASLAMKGKMPKGGNHLVDDFAKISPFGDQKVVSAQLKTIVEGELAESIQYFDGVDNATVQVTPAVDSPFEGDKKPALANVTISEKAGSQVTQDEARAMANLVSAGVEGLDKTRVTIFTRTGRALWDGQDMADGTTVANNRLDMEKHEARKRRDDLQEALNRMLGPGNAIAMVDLSLDMSSQTDKVHQEKVGKPIPTKSIDETATSGAGSAPNTAAGFGSNNTADAPTMGSGGGIGAPGGAGYKSSQKSNAVPIDTKDSEITKAVGDLKSMSITVLVNKTDKISVNPADPKDPIVSLANSALGGNLNQPGFTANVVTYPFDTSQATLAAKSEAAASSSNRMQQILSILPMVALLVVGFLVMKSIGKLGGGRPLAPALMAAGGPALSMPPQTGLQMLAAQAAGAHAKSLEGANRFVLPEIVKQKAFEAGITEEQLQAAIEEAGDAGISLDDIPSIKSKINVPLEQIKKMANEKPEMVAMLVKSWLIEEGIRR